MSSLDQYPQLVVVTGGASGIGRAVAQHFLARGARVVIGDVAEQAGKAVADEIGAEFVMLEVGDEQSVHAGVDYIAQNYGTVHALVNNAGLPAGGGLLSELDVATLDTCARVNFRGTFLMTKAFGKHMCERGTRGTIVNISSIGARQPTPGLGHYEATKAAIDALTRSAALELASEGIRVNAVAPGPVATPMTAGLVNDEQARSAWLARIPLGDIATVTDIAEAVAFLASPKARHITGVTLAVDGGQLLT